MVWTHFPESHFPGDVSLKTFSGKLTFQETFVNSLKITDGRFPESHIPGKTFPRETFPETWCKKKRFNTHGALHASWVVLGLVGLCSIISAQFSRFCQQCRSLSCSLWQWPPSLIMFTYDLAAVRVKSSVLITKCVVLSSLSLQLWWWRRWFLWVSWHSYTGTSAPLSPALSHSLAY